MWVSNRREALRDKTDKFTKDEVKHIPHVSLTTSGGVLVTLHNSEGKRPTRYELMANSTGTFTLDTLIRENKEHLSLKVQYGSFSKQEAIDRLEKLTQQPHEGSEEETAKRYRPMGLLYWDKNVDKEE